MEPFAELAATETALADRPESSATAPTDGAAPPAGRDRLEFAATVVLAVATVLTAWSAFQATKWGGVQANDYAASSALRAAATQASTRAGQLTIIDVTTFEQWFGAVANDPSARAAADTGGAYQPRPDSLEGVLYQRFRSEFRVAFDAWIATSPLTNPDAPKTPFQMAEYKVADQATATQLNQQADEQAAQARAANQRGDNYVLLTVLFASSLFFAGIGTKLRGRRAQELAIGLALVVIVAAAVVLATFPKQI